MAKKVDFKPDKPRSGFLDKLYLTPLQRKNLLKWCLYVAVLLVLSILQDVLFCKFRLFGATTELVPCGIFLICLMEGTQTGSVFALVASLLYLFSGSAAGNYSLVLLTVISFLITLLRQAFLQKGFSAAMLCTLMGLFAYELAVFFIAAFLGQTYMGRIGVSVLTAVLTALAAPVLYPLLTRICKLGGESWRE